MAKEGNLASDGTRLVDMAEKDVVDWATVSSSLPESDAIFCLLLRRALYVPERFGMMVVVKAQVCESSPGENVTEPGYISVCACLFF